MSERWARAMLSTYRWAGAAAYPFVGGYVAWRASKGIEDRNRRHERYGRARQPRPAGPLIWVHAAGEGETVAVTPLVEHFLSLGVHVVLTTHNMSSAQTCRERLGDRFVAGVVLHTGPSVFALSDRIAAAPIASLWSQRR